MAGLLTDLSWIEIIYWAAALIGGLLFLFRMVLFFIAGDVFHHGDLDFGGHVGGDFHGDFGGDVHGVDIHGADIHGADIHGGDIHGGDVHDREFNDTHSDTDASFKLLSLQGITAFFMMFGLSGLALLSSGIPTILTILGGTLVGLFTVWVISLIFSTFKRLQSEGTIRIQNTIGENGTVYLTIPPNGSGQVRVTVQGSLKIFDAVAADKKKIATGENVKVIDVEGTRTLVVEKINR